MFLPEGSGPHPGVLLVHGGGFLIGSRDMKPMQRLTTALVDAGYAVASIDYRKIFRGGSRLGGVEDAHAAMEWWFDQAPRFGVDPRRIGTVGLSAGATLMLLASERPGGTRLASRVSLFGLYDLDNLGGPLGRGLRALLLRGGDARPVSPRWVVRNEVPLTLLHGTEDALVPVEQAHQLALARRAAGVPVEVHILDGAPHGFLNVAGEHADRGVSLVLEALERDLGPAA